MKRIYIIAFFTVLTGLLNAQEKLSITKLSGIKEKLVLIKKGFPDIKNKLVTKDPDDPETLIPKVKMGDYNGRYNGEGDQQSLEYEFTSWEYAGSKEDFQAFYRKLLVMLVEVFGDKYKLKEYTPKEKEWSATLDEKDAPDYKSPTHIYIVCNWALINRNQVWLHFNGKKT
jgi:hypothetical protein